jgi:hypothetical protein
MDQALEDPVLEGKDQLKMMIESVQGVEKAKAKAEEIMLDEY